MQPKSDFKPRARALLTTRRAKSPADIMKHNKHPDAHARDSRRRFAKAVAAAFVTVPLAGASRAADSSSSSSDDAQQTRTPAAKQMPAPPNPSSPPPSPTPAAPPKPSPAAEAYAEVLRARFGAQLSPEDMTRIKGDIDGYLRTSERLRAFKLKNADEPDFVFIA